MKAFSISEVYLNDIGENTIDINPLPKNYCSFDCIFCPLGRTEVKTDKSFNFKETNSFLIKLEKILKKFKIQNVFINPDGEALANDNILNIINLIKSYDACVKLLSNGYLMNKDKYKKILNECDQVIGELAVTSEEKFKKIQRPLADYSLNEYVSNMQNFNAQYSGEFILDITILKNISDTDENVEKFKNFIEIINPNETFFETPRGKFKDTLGVSQERMNEIISEINK
ncbi:radical SAM protein [Psychrilyobacter sp.]|uniref:radical SAM protein n=1 Tax=Psychrilyobacter sp. TaxID=2586924 RepID=UPI00301712CF